jgi:hypothetical protein
MYRLGFLIFYIIIFHHNSFAQAPVLVKFTQEVTGLDRLIYTLEGYKNDKGQIIIPADYDFIWPFNNDSITIARKRIITDDYLINYYDPQFEYQIITSGGYLIHIFNPRQIPEPLSDGTFRFYDTRRKKFGFVNADGRRIVRPIFDEAGDFNEDFAPVKRSTRKNQYFSYINKSGKVAISNDFTHAFRFSEGLAVVKVKNKFHILDTKGKLTTVEDDFDEISDHYSGYFVVSKRDTGITQYGLINKSGKTVVKPSYDFIDNVYNSTAVFVKDNKVGIIDIEKKEEIIPAKYDGLFRFDQLHYLFELNGLQGLMTTDGEIFVPAKYHAIDYFRNGLAAVRKFNLWGFIDGNGEEVIPCKYSSVVSNFNNNEAIVRLPDIFLLAHKNDTLLLPNYDFVSDVFGQTMTFTKEDKVGFLDLHGDEIIEPIFEEVVINEGDVFFGKKLKDDGTESWSLINSKGKIIIHDKYLEISRYSEGFAPVKTETGWGFIDNNGVEICTPKYDMVRNFSNGVAAVNFKGNWGLINNFGMEVIPVFVKIPTFSEPEEGEAKIGRRDTLSLLRSIFPYYGYEVISDFDGQCICVEDLFRENFYDEPICLSKSGNIRRSVYCNIYVKEAEEVDMKKALNPDFETIRIKGKALRINRKGDVIQ